MKLTCEWCGKEFESKIFRKFCSKQCFSEASQYYQHLYYVERIKGKKEWKGLHKYDRQDFEQYKHSKEFRRRYNEGSMFSVVRDEKNKRLTFDRYLNDLRDAIRFVNGEKTRISIVGLRIAIFLDSLIKAWQTVVPSQDQDTDRVMRFLDADLLEENYKNTLTRLLNFEKLKIAI